MEIVLALEVPLARVPAEDQALLVQQIVNGLDIKNLGMDNIGMDLTDLTEHIRGEVHRLADTFALREIVAREFGFEPGREIWRGPARSADAKP